MNRIYTCKKCGFQTPDLSDLRKHAWSAHNNGRAAATAPASNGAPSAGVYEGAERELKQRAHRAVDDMDTTALNKAIVQLQTLRDHGTAIASLVTTIAADETPSLTPEDWHANV